MKALAPAHGSALRRFTAGLTCLALTWGAIGCAPLTALYDAIARIVDYPVRPDFTAPRSGDVMRSVLDPGRAKTVLGWEPWTPLDEGLESTVDWFRSRVETD